MFLFNMKNNVLKDNVNLEVYWNNNKFNLKIIKAWIIIIELVENSITYN